MSSTNICLGRLLPLDAVSLGRLVLSAQYPEQDFYEGDPTSFETLTTTQNDFQQSLEHEKSSGFNAFLTTLLSGARSTQQHSRLELSSAVCVTRQMQNSSRYFDYLCQHSRPTQRWLERAIRRRQDIYLVTGLKTVTDAFVEDEKGKGHSTQGRIQAPVTMAATAAAGLPPSLEPGMLDVGAGAERSRKVTERVGFVAPGEQIFAVQYRKVRYARFSAAKIESANLEAGNRWKMFLGGRGETEDLEDIIDAQIGDCLQSSDMHGSDLATASMADELFVYPIHLDEEADE
ncbi:hypothetical protein EKO04_008958 [Ascochyta lentis]|uniref:Uncharacterized protein n=1 Tax=Ascochyta lentis TaxID=205686 RepID=A0A8H7IU87_9PLEO|nr:hypothetical protein EKO04_008958 [Ascochyta lentis]